VARDAGADFVDLKHCHGYLLHEFLSAYTRPGIYGGPFEKPHAPGCEKSSPAFARAETRLISRCDSAPLTSFPFAPIPRLPSPEKPGQGIAANFSALLPYHYAFGADPANPTRPNLAEAFQFMRLCSELGIKILNLTAGSPYYNPTFSVPPLIRRRTAISPRTIL